MRKITTILSVCMVISSVAVSCKSGSGVRSSGNKASHNENIVSKSNAPAPKLKKTKGPSGDSKAYKMNNGEKGKHNFWAGVAHRIVEKNLKNKEANQRRARKHQLKEQEHLAKLNASKTKKEKKAAPFQFFVY